MPRKPDDAGFKDIIPASGKRIISDVIVPPKTEIATQFFKEPQPTIKISPLRREAKRKWRTVFVVLIILTLFVFGSVFFARMEVDIVPKSASVSIEKTLTLNKTPAVGSLVFRTLFLQDQRSGTFAATEKRTENAKAKGIVVIFNKSKNAQVLIASTRLESPNGNVYRIPKTIVVPAAKTQDGKLTAGFIEVTVMADKAGSAYNLGLADFTVPGLKGFPQYDLIFGRSKTEIQGGAEGERVVVGKGDRDAALSTFTKTILEEGISLIWKKIPAEEFLLTPSVEYFAVKEESDPMIGSAAEKFTFKADGEIRAATVARNELESILLDGNTSIAGFGNTDLRIKNLDKLKVKLISYKFDAVSFAAQFSGEAEVEAALDDAAIKNKIIENGIRESSQILSEYSYISRADVHFRPFWMRLFYKNILRSPSRIDIILQ